MPDPWSLAQDYIRQLNRQAAMEQEAAFNVRTRMIDAQVQRNADAVRYQEAERRQNDQQDFTTNENTRSHDWRVEELGQRRAYDLEDYGRERTDKLTDDEREQTQSLERTASEYDLRLRNDLITSGVGGPGVYGKVTPDGRRITSEDNYATKTSGRESGGNPNAKNPLSSATGLFQVTDGTWQQYMRQYPELGLTPDGRTDPEQQKRFELQFRADNQEQLRSAGIPPSDGNTYAAHFLGAGGAIQVLSRPDGMRLSDILAPGVLQANNFLKGMTVGDFKRWTAAKYGEDSGDSEIAGVEGQRRYTDYDFAGDAPSGVVGGAVADMPLDDGSQGERVISQAALDDIAAMPADMEGRKLVADSLVKYSQQAYDRLPDTTKDLLMTDPEDFTGMNDKDNTTRYIKLRRENANTTSLADIAGGKGNVTQGPEVTVQKRRGTKKKLVDGQLVDDE